MAVEGQGSKDKDTKVMMLVAAVTYTVGAFPESWLVWIQILLMACPMLIGSDQSHATASIVILSFGLQSMTIYVFSLTCSDIGYILLILTSGIVAGVVQRRYESRRLKSLVMSSSLFTLWSVAVAKNFLCSGDGQVIFFSSLGLCVLSIAIPLTPYCKKENIASGSQ